MTVVNSNNYARWFRDSTPYISSHREKTFVVLLGSDALAHANLINIVHDLALLHVLGVRVVLVHGGRKQIDAVLPDSVFHHGARVTTQSDIEAIAGVYGQLRARLEAQFSTGLPNTPLHNTNIAVVSGNFIIARPVGVLDGVDLLFTGTTRRVRAARIEAALNEDAIVLLSPLGYSPSGQMFNLSAAELAAEVAVSLKADKLIVLAEQPYIANGDGKRRSVLSPTELDAELAQLTPSSPVHAHYRALLTAVRAGVKRAHLVSFANDGALLSELFTAEGVGTQITEEAQRIIRKATVRDVAGIVEVIRPLEDAGVLVRRSRDRLEAEIEQFFVAELDGIVVGCCALFQFEHQAELACVAVHSSYRNSPTLQIGSRLLAHAEAAARDANVRELFVLTTQTRDWFIDAGFVPGDVDALPMPKKALYNFQRNSQVLVKTLG